MEIKPSEDGSATAYMAGSLKTVAQRNPLTLCSVPVVVHVQVWVHIPGDPQRAQLRNATTTTTNLSSCPKCSLPFSHDAMTLVACVCSGGDGADYQ